LHKKSLQLVEKKVRILLLLVAPTASEKPTGPVERAAERVSNTLKIELQ
jgi:hypothetical protein